MFLLEIRSSSGIAELLIGYMRSNTIGSSGISSHFVQADEGFLVNPIMHVSVSDVGSKGVLMLAHSRRSLL